MMTTLTRRGFLGGMSAAMLGGCRTGGGGWFGEKPRVKFGVISDIHITTPESCVTLTRAFEYFRDRKADAVVICGDLTDWGLLSGFKYIAESWERVFPNGRAPDGRKVEKIFCSGNHDYEGWWYGDMTMEMHALGYDEDEAVVKLGFKKCWENVFQEDWAPIRKRVVNGFAFVSGEWHGYDKAPGTDKMPAWFAEHGKELDPTQPFFYFQHAPIAGTTCDSGRFTGSDRVRATLNAFPSAVSLTGHCHTTFNREGAIWQGEYTALAVPSLSYTGLLGGYENGYDVRNGKSERAMPTIDERFFLQEAQGFFVTVGTSCMEVERYDFTRGKTGASPWLVPLPAPGGRPFDPVKRAAASVAPEFPVGATLALATANTETRQGKWMIAETFSFETPRNARAFDYVVRAVGRDGKTLLEKKFLSPTYHKCADEEKARQLFWLNVAELPQDTEYRFELCARNSFGKAGQSLVSSWRKGKPGLGTARR